MDLSSRPGASQFPDAFDFHLQHIQGIPTDVESAPSHDGSPRLTFDSRTRAQLGFGWGKGRRVVITTSAEIFNPPREPRRSAYARGYTKRWDKASKAFRLRFPLCGMRPGGQVPVMSACFLEGRDTPATQTDHVVPHRGDRVLFWDAVNNWQALCTTCGATKSQAGL